MNRPLIHCVDIVIFCLSWGWLGYPVCSVCAILAQTQVWWHASMVQVWCKYDPSMVPCASWCRQNGSRNYADLPSPSSPLHHCNAMLHCALCIVHCALCIVHCCIALRFGELPHPSTRSHWSTQLCFDLHSAQPLCCLHYWMKVMICVLKYVVFMDFFNEHF